MAKYIRCIKDVPVEEGLPVFYFRRGKDYKVVKEYDTTQCMVCDEFKREHLITNGNGWFDNHFRLVHTVEKEETFNMTVWTNGKAIRKYTGQDKQYPNKSRGWYKAKAQITRVVEEMEIKQ